jgi:hypothetical protein
MSPLAVEAIERLKELPANWDSYGAPPIDHLARRHAAALVTELQVMLQGRYVDPTVGPDVGGGVELIWETPREAYEVHVFVPPMGIPKAVVLHDERLVDSVETKLAADVLATLQRFHVLP